MLVKLDHFPKFRGENKKSLSCHHPVIMTFQIWRKCEKNQPPKSTTCSGWCEPPPSNCSFVRHLVEKMAILKAHLLITIITSQCWRGIFLTTVPFGVVSLDKVIKSPRFSLMTCNQTLGTPMVGHGLVCPKSDKATNEVSKYLRCIFFSMMPGKNPCSLLVVGDPH